MRVLLLVGEPETWPVDWVLDTIEKAGDIVQIVTGKITDSDADLIVSYGYRHVLKGPILARKCFNLHIGYLPWNRGTYPNFWSWFDHTPKGVTIHEIDAGIDTGPIVAQELTPMSDCENLASSHCKLQANICGLFARKWPLMRSGAYRAIPQPPGGSTHRDADFEAMREYLPKGFFTACRDVERLRGDMSLLTHPSPFAIG